MLNVVDAESLVHDLPPANDTALAFGAVVIGLAFVWGIVAEVHRWLYGHWARSGTAHHCAICRAQGMRPLLWGLGRDVGRSR